MQAGAVNTEQQTVLLPAKPQQECHHCHYKPGHLLKYRPHTSAYQWLFHLL